MEAMQTGINANHISSVPMEVTFERFICNSFYLHFLCAALITSELKSHCSEM